MVRRVGYLFEPMIEEPNLAIAWTKARKGCSQSPEVLAFETRVIENLREIARCVSTRTYQFGPYRQFTIRDPKPRMISAPPFRDRVLHHALMQVVEPILERAAIHDSYACRQGKGVLRAVQRAQHFARRWPVVLRVDVRKYFDNIDHQILLRALARVIKDKAILELIRALLNSFEASPGKGLPIGALTSQHLANFYLASFDHWWKETIGVRGYVRYMDDMVIFGSSFQEARMRLRAARAWLRDNLALALKPAVGIAWTDRGFAALEFRIDPRQVLLSRRGKNRLTKKILAIDAAHASGQLDEARAQVLSRAAFAWARQVPSLGLRKRIAERLRVAEARRAAIASSAPAADCGVD